MIPPPLRVVVTHRFPTAAERVFDAWLDPHWIGRWMYGPPLRQERVVRLATEPRVGGRFSFVVDRAGVEVIHHGTYLEIDRPQLLVFTWGTGDGQPDVSRVVVELTPLGAGCQLTLTHVLAARWANFAVRAPGAWRRMLTALDHALVEAPVFLPSLLPAS
jgi:uncharacterized protein YndB with AHSA1/START domain